MIRLRKGPRGKRHWPITGAEYRQFVYHSDAVCLKGKVVKKYEDSQGGFVVHVDPHGVNHRGDDTVPGLATVALPSRRARTWPLEKRLPPKEYRGTGTGVYFA